MHDFTVTTNFDIGLLIAVRNNCDWNQPFQVSDYDANTSVRSPHDLTGAKLRMQLKAFVNGALATAVALDASTTNGYVVVGNDPTIGGFTVKVPATEMATLTAGVYLGDMLVFNTDGTVLTVFTLKLEVKTGETVPTAP